MRTTLFSVMGLAWFVSARMQRERDLLDVIRFVDTRLQFGDNERVARMVALMNGIPNAPERTSATEGS